MPTLSDLLQQGLRFHQAGQLHQAELLYRQILQADPRNFDAIHLLGLIAHQVNRNDLAGDYLQNAIRLNPTFPAAHNNMGNVLIAVGKLDDAIAAFRHAVRLKPDYVEALGNLGNALRLKGNLDEAINVYQQAIRLKPNHVEAIFNLANALSDQGKLEEAINTYRQALRLKPDFAEAHSNLGNALRNQGKLDEAIASYRQAVRVKPDFADGFNNLGNALREQGKFEEATANCQRAVQLKPEFPEAFNNLGNALKELGKLDDAIASYQQAVRLKPDFAQAFSNLGNALNSREKFDEAVANCRQAVQLKPDFVEAYNNLGNALQGLEQFDEAIACYRQAVSLRPDFPEAHVNLALPLLLLGNFAEGWPEYAWRWRSADFLKTAFYRPSLPGQDWDGSPLNGRSILLHAEQGLGDTIQFGRYASLLKEQGAGEVLLLCPAALQRLMRTCRGIHAVFTADPLPAFDVQAYLLSLPLLLSTSSIERIPANVPYLDTDPDLVERWQGKIAALEGDRSSLRVGIVWQGNPDNKSDRQRSVRLEQFAPLAEQAGVRLFSLQKGAGSEQLAKMPDLAIDIGTELIDLADAAAVVRCLDLVISVDTVVAHLAGALGIPVWLALARVPDWRWGMEREDSPWYPSMRLFRQPERGRWEEVFRRMREAVATLRGNSP